MKLTKEDNFQIGYAISRLNDHGQYDNIMKYITNKQILKNQDNIEPDKAFEYVMENMYDEVKERVFEQEAENKLE